METKKYLFSIGSISFFEESSKDSDFYWKDMLSDVFHGPFQDLNATVTDCKKHLNAEKDKITHLLSKDPNVISVDFINKRKAT